MNENETNDAAPAAKKRRSAREAFVTVTMAPELLAKIDTVARAQGISRARYVRNAVIADLLRLKIPVTEKETSVGQGTRNDISAERRAQIAAAKAERERRLIARMKKTFKELPMDLQVFYKNGVQS